MLSQVDRVSLAFNQHSFIYVTFTMLRQKLCKETPQSAGSGNIEVGQCWGHPYPLHSGWPVGDQWGACGGPVGDQWSNSHCPAHG